MCLGDVSVWSSDPEYAFLPRVLFGALALQDCCDWLGLTLVIF